MKNILIPVDLSEVTEKSIKEGIKLARAMGSRLHILHVIDRNILIMPCFPGEPVYVPEHFIKHQDNDMFPGIYEEMLKKESIRHDVKIKEGSPELEILTMADDIDADLIIMGSHGHGAIYHLLLGSVSENVLKSAKCPVMLVKSDIKD
jgi:nucleotide-binding universal stress UspA family protein